MNNLIQRLNAICQIKVAGIINIRQSTNCEDDVVISPGTITKCPIFLHKKRVEILISFLENTIDLCPVSFWYLCHLISSADLGYLKLLEKTNPNV